MAALIERLPWSAAASSPVRDARQASPLLWRAAIAFAALFAACVALQFADPRLFNGISVWVKPAKFFSSFALHMATLAWGLSMLPIAVRMSRAVRWIAPSFVGFASFEMLYMVFRAARAEASHFNSTSPTAEILYGLMGAAAVAMMIITAYAGWLILKQGERRELAFGTGLGFILAPALTILVAGYLGHQESHWIGGDQTDATGLPFFGWSTTGGDLRISHFVALHLMQVLPLAAFIGGRILAIAAAILGTMLTGGLFVQAVMGMPFLAL